MFLRSKRSISRSNTCFGAVSFERFLSIIGQNVLLSTITIVDEEFHYESSWSAVGYEARDSWKKCAQARDINPESSKTSTRGLKGSKSPRGCPILNYPKPDYSIIAPKVDTWRMEQDISRKDKVSGAVNMCVCMILVLHTHLHIFTQLISDYIHDTFPQETTLISAHILGIIIVTN
jgi:hypothetical protein